MIINAHTGEKYIEILKKWGVGDLNHFWMHFDEIDFKHRKELLLKTVNSF